MLPIDDSSGRWRFACHYNSCGLLLRVLVWRNRRKAWHCPVEVDVDLKEDGLSHDDVKRLVIQLVKHLLYQRKQVPCSIDSIKKDLEVGMPPPSTHTDDPPTSRDPARAQEYLRRKRLAAKQMRTREKYLTRAKTFVDNCQVLEDDLVHHLDRHTEKLSCVFGASPAHPKEVYIIVFPPPVALRHVTSEKACRKAMLALFRSMTTNEKLFNMFGSTSVPSTNMFVAVNKPASHCTGLVTRPGFKDPPQCRHVIIRIRQDPPPTDLFFATPVQPPRFTPIGSTCTPVPMDLCTPLVIHNRQARFSSQTPGGDLMLETPCVKRKCSPITEDEYPRQEKRSSVEMDQSDALTSSQTNSSDEWYFLPKCLKGFSFPKC